MQAATLDSPRSFLKAKNERWGKKKKPTVYPAACIYIVYRFTHPGPPRFMSNVTMEMYVTRTANPPSRREDIFSQGQILASGHLQWLAFPNMLACARVYTWFLKYDLKCLVWLCDANIYFADGNGTMHFYVTEKLLFMCTSIVCIAKNRLQADSPFHNWETSFVFTA